MMYNTYM